MFSRKGRKVHAEIVKTYWLVLELALSIREYRITDQLLNLIESEIKEVHEKDHQLKVNLTDSKGKV